MVGKIVLQEGMWYITRLEENEWQTYYPLHPDNQLEIREWSKSFDNVEARILAQPEVEFEIVDYWETGLEGSVKVAKLLRK